MKRYQWIGITSRILPFSFVDIRVHPCSASGAYSLPEGRTCDQAHNTGYIDWSGSAQYVYITHRDGSSLPPEEGGAFCGSNVPNGSRGWAMAVASGPLTAMFSYFEIMVGFTPDPGVGNAVFGPVLLWIHGTCKTGSSTPGFVSMAIVVPAGCRSPAPNRIRWLCGFSFHRRGIQVHPQPHPLRRGHPRYADHNSHADSNLYTSLTPTLTFTPTMTFTPTATFTNTSPTPTPLPPQIQVLWFVIYGRCQLVPRE